MDAVELLLQSNRKNPRGHCFYESCGFEPGVRTAYVANRPPGLNFIAGRPNWNGGRSASQPLSRRTIITITNIVPRPPPK
jgi:hypothetical protein